MIRNIHDIPSLDDRPTKFAVGQLVKHRRYGYRGVIVAVDNECKADQQWYWTNQTQPSREQPWYHVLVDGSSITTYPAQENLLPDTSSRPVNHPLVDQFFSAFEDGRYIQLDEPGRLA